MARTHALNAFGGRVLGLGRRDGGWMPSLETQSQQQNTCPLLMVYTYIEQKRTFVRCALVAL